MRYLSETDKEIIKFLSQHKMLGALSFGHLYKDEICKRGELSIMTSPQEGLCYMFLQNSVRTLISESISKIVEIISVMKLLEEEGYIYLVKEFDSINCSHANVYYQDLKATLLHIDNPGLKYSNHYVNIKIGDKHSVFTCYDTEKLVGFSLDERLGREVIRYFDSNIYVTPKLRTFVDNDYKTEEALRYEKELSVAKKSYRWAIGAVVAAVVIPILCIPLTNNCGKSTINEEQFEKIEAIGNKIDTITLSLKQNIIDQCKCPKSEKNVK